MNWYEAELIGQKAESPTVRRFWFKLKTEEPLPYQAGQFLTFDLPTGEKRKDRWRSYSIANDFDGSNLIELCISYLKGGLASEYFFETINKGDLVKCKGPEGAFTLPDARDQALVLICTGTGIVPFRAMMQDLEKNGNLPPAIHLIFGARKTKDILYHEEIMDWASYVPGFKASICLSRETKIPGNLKNLEYLSGYVHQAYLHSPAPTANTLFMICGWTQVIDEVVANLVTKMGVGRSQIRFELFG